MKLTKKILCGALAATFAASCFTACSNNSGTGSNGTSNPGTSDSDTSDKTSTSNGGNTENSGSSEIIEAPSNGSVLKWLSYYDLNTNDKEMVDKFNDAGYTVEYTSTTSAEYFVKLSQLISSDDAPDMVGYEWQSFPHGITKNLYTPMDSYIDFTNDTWVGMKETIDNFNYGGKHYYVPYQMRPGVALLYNATALEDEGISEDPFELYQEGDWTWSKWKEIMTEWCDLGDDYYGVMPTGFVAMPFIVSTGTPLIDVDGASKEIRNNMKDANVQRCQDLLQELAKQGMVYAEYTDPSTVFADGKILFAEFGVDWGFESAQGAMKDAEIRFVPIPRDDKADKYYMNSDTFGYLVPAGAKNIKAAIKYMEICRLNEIDPERIEQAKSEATAEELYYPKCPECKVSSPDKTLKICPNCGAERRLNAKHHAMSEELYALKEELKNPTSEQFTFLFDDCFGFSQDLTKLLQEGDAEGAGCILGGPFKTGESYTSLRDSYFGTVESYIEPYRKALAEMQ